MTSASCKALVFIFFLAEAAPPRWRQLNQEARAAVQAKDYAALRTTLIQLKPLLPGNPRVTYNLAAAEARLGHPDLAIEGLGHWSHMGLIYDVAHDDDFSSLAETRGFAEISAQIEKNKQPVSNARLAFRLSEADLIPEDLAYDPVSKSFLVSSVREAKILRGDGRFFAKTDGPVFALAVDAKRRVLWATTGWVPHCRACNLGMEGETALLAYGLDSAKLLKRLKPPAKGLLGDMTISRNGDLYISEGMNGSVFLFHTETETWDLLAGSAEFPSPQTPALSADENTLFVPDYIRGIAAIDLRTRVTRWLQPTDGIALSGIDGLYKDGDGFIAVQNGVNPPRIVRFSPDLRKQTIIEANTPSLGEPTHGVVKQRQFYFIANSGWGQYDEQGRKKPGSKSVNSSVQVIDLKP